MKMPPPKCKDCMDTGWLIYEKPAPSPPYAEGKFLEYGVYCYKCEKGR